FTTPPTIRISGSNIASSGPGCNPISGDLADVQIYNTALSANQIQALYQEGINGTPIVPRNLVGWWPLDGNANDYSGAGDNGAISGPIIFPTVAQITAQVLNQYGTPLKNALVGFATDLGTFSNGLGSGQSAAAYTDSNGIASVLLTQQNASGYADVKAAAFNFVSPIESNVVAWYPLDFGTGNAVYDISGNGNNGAMNGQPYWNFPKYVSRFNGNNSQIQIQPTVALNSTTFTVNLWVRPLLYGNAGDNVSTPDTNGYSSVIAGHGYTGMWWFEFRDNNQLNFYVGNTVSGSYTTPTITNAFPELGQWYMLTGTYSPSAGIIKLYINGGSEVATATSSIIPGGGSPIIISGSNPAQTTGGYFKGDIANMQIYNTVLSPSQIQQLYQSGIAALPISNAGLIGWWPLDGNANDYSGAGDNGTIVGNLAFAPTSKVISKSLALNGSMSSMLSAKFNGVSSTFKTYRNITTNNFTLTFWVNGANTLKMVSGNGYTIFNSSGSKNFEFWLNNGGSLGASPGSGDEEIGVGSNSYHGYGINGSEWNFVAVTLANGTASFYANSGVPYNVSIVNGPYSLNALSIGESAASISPFNGSIANIQLYNRKLTPSQVESILAGGMSGLPLPNSNLSAWWPLDGNANDYSGNGNNATVANVVFNNVMDVKPYLLQSLNKSGVMFNGQASYIDLGNPSDLQFSSSNTITISAWINVNQCFANGANGAAIVGHGSDSYTFYVAPVSGPCNLEWAESTVANIGTGPIIPEKQWINVVAVNKIGSNTTLYVDGVKYGPYPFTNTYSYTQDLRIGSSQSDTNGFIFNGSISNVQIYNTPLNQTQVTQLFNGGMPKVSSITIPLSWLS
ncbi:MAG: LamG-like jellyroll fold domain-containing protein, partial [Candidatus Micrarchaeia archaeon]